MAGYTGREAVAEGEAFDPTPANIDARTERFTLANGFKVAFLPKRNRGGAVTVSLGLRYGTESALMGKATAGSMAGGMLMRGTTKHSSQEIADELDRLKAQGRVGGGVQSASGSFSTIRENLPAVLRLAGEMLSSPAFDPDEFELLRQERLAAIEAQMSEPQALTFQAFQRHMSPWPKDHPLYTPTLEEQKARLEAVTVEEARSFWEAFYGAQGGTLAIVGDFDPAEIRPIIEEEFGSWTSREAYARIDQPYQPVEAAEVDIETPDKANAMMLAGVAFQMRDDDPDYPALLMANTMMGGGFLNSRLAERIRGEEGLSYAVQSQLVAPPIDDTGLFLALAIFAPQNADKVVAAFRDEMARAIADGFTEEELEAAKKGYLDAAQNGRANDVAIAAALQNELFLDRTMAFTAAQEAAIGALTVDEVNAAFRRYVDPAAFSIFRGGDFANKLVP